jgi:hypothetical protein
VTPVQPIVVREALLEQPLRRKLRHWPPGMDKTPFMPPFFLTGRFDDDQLAGKSFSPEKFDPRAARG